MIDYIKEDWYFGQCLGCERTLRKSNYPKNSESVVHKGYGFCPKCYWNKRSREELPHRGLIDSSSINIQCSKCNRELPKEKMKTRKGRPTRTCKICSKLWERYHLKYSEYIRMYREQDGKCSICLKKIYESTKIKDRIVVDHCHNSGRVRGLLCNSCNIGVGVLKKGITSNKVEEYLNRDIQVPLEKCYCSKCRASRNSTGISCTQMDYLMIISRNSCQICLDSFDHTPYIDHDHSCCGKRRKYSCFFCIRGVLCRNCNSMLGMFIESPTYIGRAIKYLEVEEK